MRHLNDITGFNWVSSGRENRFAKVSICGERFWLKDCEQKEDGSFVAVVNNYPLCTKEHGLKFGDEVSFTHG